jgi:hypothetical protein
MRGMELRLNTMDFLRVQVRPFGEMDTPGNTGAGNSSASCGEPIETAPHKGSASTKATWGFSLDHIEQKWRGTLLMKRVTLQAFSILQLTARNRRQRICTLP